MKPRIEAMQRTEQETFEGMPKITIITDLGPGNEGAIFPDQRIPDETVREAVADLERPEYRKPASSRWRCVDGRITADGLKAGEHEADPQLAGAFVIADLSVDWMVEVLPKDALLSKDVAEKTKEAIDDGITVVVHGDNHVDGLPAQDDDSLPKTNKAGCGANKQKREILRSNARNADVVVPICVTLARAASIADLYTGADGQQDDNVIKDRLNELIANGKLNAEHETYWDVGPEETVDIIVANGGEYEELIEEHAEVVALVDMADGAFDEEAFMADHTLDLPDGTQITIEAFVASIGEYKKHVFKKAEKTGQPLVSAADRVLAVLLQSTGVVKKLTGPGFLAAVATPQ